MLRKQVANVLFQRAMYLKKKPEGRKKRPEEVVGRGREQGREKGVGNGVLSHRATATVPSALVSLTAGFGMGPGVPSRL